MKLLVISLLRIGDLAMHSLVVSRLRKAHPDAEIHVLTNRSNLEFANLLNVEKVHVFERERMQASMRSAETCIFEAFDEFPTWFDALTRKTTRVF